MDSYLETSLVSELNPSKNEPISNQIPWRQNYPVRIGSLSTLINKLEGGANYLANLLAILNLDVLETIDIEHPPVTIDDSVALVEAVEPEETQEASDVTESLSEEAS